MYYKNPRGICPLCKKECALRNIEPRHHRCKALPKYVPSPPVIPAVSMHASISLPADELRAMFSPEQLHAIMTGVAQCLAAQQRCESAQSVDAVDPSAADPGTPPTRDEKS